MAEKLGLDVDPLFTMDVVRDFMLANGGKVSNHTLVTHFKSFLNDSQRKNANRQMFKQYVNTLAVVKLDLSGEKLLVLKKKYRDSGSFRGEPAAAKFLPSDQDRVKAKRAKTDDALIVETTDDTGLLTSENETLNDNKENLKKTSSGNSLDLPPAVDDKTDEELEISADDQLIESSASNLRSSAADDMGQLSVSADTGDTDVTPLDSSASTEMSAVENVNDDEHSAAARNAVEISRADVVDSMPTAARLSAEDTAKREPLTPESNVSVREMAKQLNKADSPASVIPRGQTTPQTPGRTRRERESRRHDEGGGYEFSLSESEREWTIKSAYSDYQAMSKLLLTNPSLAGRRDFLSGYTALHWAAKNGVDDVVKLLFGSKEPPNVNARSHGGYTPLHIATIHGQDSVVRLLVEVYGANPNVRDYSGRKPKHYFAYSAVSARVQQLLQPPPPGTAQHAGSNKRGRLAHLDTSTGRHSEGTTPSPGSSPGPSSRKGSVNSDSGLMPPPRELPAVIRRRPVGSSSSVDSAGDRDKHCHSDSEMHHAGSETELHGSGSTPNFSAFV